MRAEPRHAPLLLVAATLALAPAAAAAADWPFPDEMRSRLVFLHPLANYVADPRWQRAWERELARTSGVRITSGSVSTDDLFTDLTVNVDEALDTRFRFLYRGTWRQGLHLDAVREEHMLGFEAGLAGPLGAWLAVHPAPDKEDLDLAAGLVLTGPARARYVRVGVRWDDPLHGAKNDVGGVSGREAVRVVWEARGTRGRWEAFSSGRYGGGARRTFPDADASPLVAATFRREGEGVLRLRHVRGPQALVGLEVRHVRFQAEERGRDGGEGFTYDNAWLHVRLLAVAPLGRRWGLRPELHGLRQWTSATGLRDLTHRRGDVFPALWLERRGTGRGTWEVGYLATWYSWRGDVAQEGFTDKVALAWTWAFRPGARLKLLLSHERDLDRFGGGNVQFQATF